MQASSTTVRMLESLVRVAQAHARLMARGEVGRGAGWLWGGLDLHAGPSPEATFMCCAGPGCPSHLHMFVCTATPSAQVLLQDAVVAVWLIDACSDGHSVLGDMVGAGSNGGHQPFPDNPDAEYARLEQAVTAAVLSQREWNLLTY